MMDTMILILCIFAIVIAVGALIGVLIVALRDRREDAGAAGSFRGSQTSLARSWHLDLYDMNSGWYLSKDFCGQVMLGRSSGNADSFWRMPLGAYPTISREQCIIYDRGGFLMVENVSSVNVTGINGYPLTKPFMLTKGCQLSAGGVDFYVAEVYRIN